MRDTIATFNTSMTVTSSLRMQNYAGETSTKESKTGKGEQHSIVVGAVHARKNFPGLVVGANTNRPLWFEPSRETWMRTLLGGMVRWLRRKLLRRLLPRRKLLPRRRPPKRPPRRSSFFCSLDYDEKEPPRRPCAVRAALNISWGRRGVGGRGSEVGGSKVEVTIRNDVLSHLTPHTPHPTLCPPTPAPRPPTPSSLIFLPGDKTLAKEGCLPLFPPGAMVRERFSLHRQ